MGDCNLDEFDPLVEDSGEADCPLCEHDVAWLSVQHKVLMPKCSRRALYSTLHKVYEKRMAPLKRQGHEIVEVSRGQIERHFEEHQLSHTRGLQEDARICKQLMCDLQKRMKRSDGSVDATALSQWKSLSAYKLSLLSKLSKTNRTTVVKDEPYAFT